MRERKEFSPRFLSNCSITACHTALGTTLPCRRAVRERGNPAGNAAAQDGWRRRHVACRALGAWVCMPVSAMMLWWAAGESEPRAECLCCSSKQAAFGGSWKGKEVCLDVLPGCAVAQELRRREQEMMSLATIEVLGRVVLVQWLAHACLSFPRLRLHHHLFQDLSTEAWKCFSCAGHVQEVPALQHGHPEVGGGMSKGLTNGLAYSGLGARPLGDGGSGEHCCLHSCWWAISAEGALHQPLPTLPTTAALTRSVLPCRAATR